jgi:oxalate decarboxylase
MATEKQIDGSAYTRRELLGAASLTAAGLATASLVAAPAAGAAPPMSSPDDRLTIAGGDPLKQDPSLDAANPDSLVPPATDHGDVPTFKYPFSFGRNRVQPGGWARQVTVRDLPVSTDLAGVNMRLTAGGIRELHWHLPAEWSMMLYGSARITGVDQHGRSFVSDVKEGDLWYFPPGIPHSIQGLEPDGCEFLLVFDDGNFSEFDTFSISDWVAHTPRGVLAKNFSVAEATFNPIPKGELYIFQGQMPPALSMDRGR